MNRLSLKIGHCRIKVLCLIILVAGWVGASAAEDIAELRTRAESGDAPSQASLGRCYADGNGVAKDLVEAVKWLRKAVEQGNADAQCDLGTCYALGIGLAKDPAEAVKWYRKAAEQGNANAQNRLGHCYATGTGGVEKDPVEAVKWYQKAVEGFRKEAEGGNAVAQLQLGACYVSGMGVEKNQAEAVKWFRKAADQGNADAQRRLGVCYANGEGVPKDPDEAVKWYRKAAEQGDAVAQASLGACYVGGLGVEKDPVEAVKWYRKAAEQGDADAQYNLGGGYAKGYGVAKDPVEAVKWLRKAADQGHANAQFRLGTCYASSGVPGDTAEAVKWWRKAAEQGNADAQAELARRSEPIRPSARQALKDRVSELQKLQEDIRKLEADADVYTEEKRVERRKLRDAKLSEFRMLSQQLNEMKASAALEENSSREQHILNPKETGDWIRAIADGNISQVRNYIGQGADVNSRSYTDPQYTLLTLAVLNKRKDIIDLFIREGADVNLADSNGWTPLHWACFKGDAAMVSLLLAQNGIQVNAQDKSGISPAMFSTKCNKPECLRLLLEAGAVYNRSLVTAAFLGDVQAVREFLDKGANVNDIVDKWPPLAAAARNSHVEIVKMLLDKGANVNVTTSTSGETALHIASGFGNSEVVALLLEKTKQLELKDCDGDTPLVGAIRQYHPEVARLLIAKGASVNVRISGTTALCCAATVESQKSPPTTALVAMLLDAGANVNESNESSDPERAGETPLIPAAFYLNPFMVKYLIEKGARVSAKTQRGATALMIAQGNRSAMGRGFEGGKYRNQTIQVLLNPDAAIQYAPQVGRDSAAAPQAQADATSALNAKVLTKEQWRARLSSNYPVAQATGGASLQTTVEDFVSKMGCASRTQTVGKTAYWYYKCSDGDIQVCLLADYLLMKQIAVSAVNDY